LFFGAFEFFAAGAAGASFKVLRLSASFVFASDHQQPGAQVAPLASCKGKATAMRTDAHKTFAATSAGRLAALDIL